MSERLMDAKELARVTGFKRHSNQAEWFKDNFGIDVVRCADGSLVMTWTQFDALLAKSQALRLPRKQVRAASISALTDGTGTKTSEVSARVSKARRLVLG